MQGPEQRCLLRRRRASRPGFRPPPLQPPPGLPEPRPPQPHLRRLETRALGGAEEGGGRAEPGSTAASRPLSGAKPERERERERRAGRGGREGSRSPRPLRRRLPGARLEGGEGKAAGQEAAGARSEAWHTRQPSRERRVARSLHAKGLPRPALFVNGARISRPEGLEGRGGRGKEKMMPGSPFPTF